MVTAGPPETPDGAGDPVSDARSGSPRRAAAAGSGSGRAAAGDLRLARTLERLDRVTFSAERPVRRLVGSNRLNPLPHAGTISVFLLGVVILSGVYVTLFFSYGAQASYHAVSALESHAVQKVVRAVHRYSSAALVLTTLVHAWRVFVGGRFTGRPRRWRWATGVSALVIVWLAGVTGYWLVQDVRAQALSDAAAGLLARFSWGAGVAARRLSAVGTGTGSGLVLLAWFVHLGLTAVVGWFLFRHLRRSRLPWLPPRHWMIVMGAGLVLVSLAFPLGMLPAASADRLPGHMPLDPFVLFLLPPLLSAWRWAAVLGGLMVLAVGLVLPRLLRRADPAPVVIDADRCTGCDLCVVDCPYQALRLEPSAGGPGAGGAAGPAARPVAVVDPAACVACGICLGSCAFDAISAPWAPAGSPGSAPGWGDEVAGRAVVVACDRHAALSPSALSPSAVSPSVLPSSVLSSSVVSPAGLSPSGDGDDGVPVVLRVRCAGMFAPGAIGQLMEAGATGVHLVGCPPHDCRYGVGNTLAAERLAGSRAPHPARRWTAAVAQDWVAPTELGRALADPGAHPQLDDSHLPGRRDVILGAALLVAGSLVGVAFATRAPFHGSDASAVRVVVDHEAGQPLLLSDSAHGFTPAPGSAPVGGIERIDVSVDGRPAGSRAVRASGPTSLGVADLTIDPGTRVVAVTAVVAGGPPVTLFDGPAELARGRRLVVSVTDVPPPPGAAEGKALFEARSSGCTVCHSRTPGDKVIGPSLAGVADRAATRVPGLSAELYLRQSILLPDQYVVAGFPAGQMLPIYRQLFTEQQLDALIAYLMTLTAGGGTAGGGTAGGGG